MEGEKTLYHEEVRDLLRGTGDYYLAHCVSADFSVSAGIVVRINMKYGVGDKLRKGWPGYLRQWMKEGKRYDCLLTDKVFNLVTKTRYNDKPTYDAVRGALELMRDTCVEKGITKVAMPQIACGLDGLKWERVSQIIRQTFDQTGIEVMICRLKR